MSREFTAFFGQKARHQVGFPFQKQLHALVGWDLFFQDRLADPNAAFVLFLGHSRSQKRAVVFVNFDQFG